MSTMQQLTTQQARRPEALAAVRRRLRLRISAHPSLYAAYARWADLPFRLTDATTVIVDSYPRSGNSFFEAAFTRAHQGRETVAHHAHAAGQVIAGARRGLPCVVLVREPEAAIASFHDLSEGGLSVPLCTQEYVVFYEALLPLLPQLLVVETGLMETRFCDLMQHLRDRHGLKVDPYEIDTQVRTELFEAVDHTGRQRNGFGKERYSESLSDSERSLRRRHLDAIREAVRAPANASLLVRARSLYERFAAHAF